MTEKKADSRILWAEHLKAGYAHRVIVDDVSFDLYPGEIVTLIGPNGAGKSTLLKSIIRQLPVFSGTVYLEGESMARMKDSCIAEKMSMVMTQRLHPEYMTCRDVAATGRYPYTGRLGILSEEDWGIVDEALQMMHADIVANQDFTKVSDGQRQRVMLARALCQQPAVLILDEPTSFLDMRFKLDILSGIRKMARERKLAVLMSLHEVDLARKVSDQILCIQNGKAVRSGTPEEIFAGNYIQKLYGVEEKCFDSRLGMMNLPADAGDPAVFVICGGGTGIGTFYALQRKNIPFAAGVLYENDIDYAVASSVAGTVVSARAFYPVPEDCLEAAKKLIDKSEKCLCTLTGFGPYNEVNRILKEYARMTGKLQEQIE